MLRRLAGPLFALALVLFLISRLGGVGFAGGFHHKSPGIPSASGPCPGLGDVTASEINGAAKDLGISCKVVYQQINYESGGRDVTSYANAKGPAQFLQGTWDSHHCPGSIHDHSAAMRCYVIFMGELIRSTGSLRNALAAYNAGPGNIPAGLGYADHILRAAGLE